MRSINKVVILFYPLRERPVNPLSIFPEDLGAFRTVSFIPSSPVFLNKAGGLTKHDLFKHIPGLQDFVERGFHNKVIVSFSLDITVMIENGGYSCSVIPEMLARHLADTSLRGRYS